MPNVNASRAHRTRKQSLPIQGLFFILLLICGGYALLNSSLFALAKTNVIGVRELKPEEVIKLGGINKGTNIFKLKINQIEQKISLHPLVKSVTVTRKLPDGLNVVLTERVPIGVIPQGDSFYAIDREGVFLYEVNSIGKINLPIITGVKIDKVKPGERISSDGLGEAATFLTAMPPEITTVVSEIYCKEPENIIMYTIDSVEVRLGNSDKAKEKLQVYSQVISQKYREKIQYIDLSYQSKPVIKFYSSQK